MRHKCSWLLTAAVLLLASGCQDGLIDAEETIPPVQCECELVEETSRAGAQLETLDVATSVCDPVSQAGCQANETCVFIRYAAFGRWQASCVSEEALQDVTNQT